MDDASLRQLYQRSLAASRGGDRRECPSPEELQQLAVGVGPDPQRLDGLEHVMSCPHCLPEYELLRLVARSSRVKPRRVWLPAVGLAAGIVLVSAGLLWRATRPPGDQLRGGTPAVRLIGRARIWPKSAGRPFLWHTHPPAERYRFTLFSAAGEMLYMGATADTALTLPDSVALPAGVYQWGVTALLPDGGEVESNLGELVVGEP